MSKEGIPSGESFKSAENHESKILQRIKYLSMIGSALTVAVGGYMVEHNTPHLDKGNENDGVVEDVDKNIYIPEDKPEVQELLEFKNLKKDNKPKENKDVFIESIPNREITEIENKLEKEIPIYGEKAKEVKRIIPRPPECYKAPHIPYRHVTNRPGFPDVKPFGRETIYGNESMSWRIVEVLKYKVLTSAVERRYNLPPNLIMAMIIQESGGKEFLPNGSGDGGFGLSHMQGETSKRFGLRTICHSLVCNGSNRSCKNIDGVNLNHGKKLKDIINKEKAKASRENYDFRKTLANTDERLNHLANIDAVGRMLFKAILDWTPNNQRTGISEIDNDPFKTAVCVYTGTVNFNKYWKNICKYVEDIDNIEKLQKEWSKHEKGSKTTLDTYLYRLQHYNATNYGVNEYIKLPCYTSNNSKAVLNLFKKILPKHKEHFFSHKQTKTPYPVSTHPKGLAKTKARG